MTRKQELTLIQEQLKSEMITLVTYWKEDKFPGILNESKVWLNIKTLVEHYEDISKQLKKQD